MASDPDEENVLRSVALQNARSVLAARQRVEEALRKQSDWLRITLASIGDGVISTDADGRVTFMNGVAEVLTGWPFAEATGRLLPEVFHIVNEHSRLSVENPALRALRDKVIVGLANHTLLIARDGTERPIDDSAAPIRDGAETPPVGAVLIFRDVSERRQMERALRDSDRKKNDFIALLAHELRNPLAPMRNGLQILKLASADAESVKQARAMMERQLEHMIRLIDDLLDISRISQNKIDLRRAPTPLVDVVRSAVETARPVIESFEHELVVNLPSERIVLHADLTRLAQVFSNLLTNSAKYTERRGRIVLTAERAGDYAIISVKDNGIGIPAKFLSSIFDMFSQVDRTIERSTGGLGIGLALVKAFVEMHDGVVSAASAGPGMGSTFTVTLPALQVAPLQPTTLPTNREAKAAGPKRRVLVVDDNVDSAISMALMLELKGNEIRTAHDGVDAVAIAEAFRPQVILMDVGMPRRNGLDATRQIRAQAWGRDVVIIALTGWGQENDKTRSQEAGCDGHLVKPVDLADLEKMLSKLMPEPSV